MTKVGERLLKAADEAIAIARGEKPPAGFLDGERLAAVDTEPAKAERAQGKR